ncbi:hypothetical protein [Sulfuricurvum sp.]|uniref:hypothetical protein n=1 Tax=Sulfuricurvum sp. TaxID=2025608 RepID=UPI002631FE5F|nr:hypothetical protein [Sulfuricurvum sp.]MDD3595209.1 hypothetical protein [Sulfuricurvum sp.]
MENHSDTKYIKIIIVSLMVMVVIVLMYLTKPSDQDHANALSEKLSGGGYTTLAHVLSPSPVYTDLVIISCTTLAGHLLTIGVFDYVYVHARFQMIQSKAGSNNGQGV